MSVLILILVASLFAASTVCGVCYGVAIRDYGQRHELGHPDKSPYCVAAIGEEDRFLIIGLAAYLFGIAVLVRVFWTF